MNPPPPGIDLSGRRWRRRNYSFQHRMSRREGAVPERDDGVCLTTLRDRRVGPVKGGVRRQAPSRLREPLKAVMEPAPPPSRPIPGNIRFRHFCSNRPWNGLERACLRNNSGITRKKVLPAPVISHINRPLKPLHKHFGY